MTDRIHERDVKAALKQVMLRYPRGTRFQYEPVEPSAAAPARLWIMDDEFGGSARTSFPGLDHGMLGWTRKEAHRTLLGIVAGMEAQRVLQRPTIEGARKMVARSGLSWSNEEANKLDAELVALTAGF